jgi:hypothetical protein
MREKGQINERGMRDEREKTLKILKSYSNSLAFFKK